MHNRPVKVCVGKVTVSWGSQVLIQTCRPFTEYVRHRKRVTKGEALYSVIAPVCAFKSVLSKPPTPLSHTFALRVAELWLDKLSYSGLLRVLPSRGKRDARSNQPWRLGVFGPKGAQFPLEWLLSQEKIIGTNSAIEILRDTQLYAAKTIMTWE